MFQFPPIGRKLRKPSLYQAAVLCSRNRRLPNHSYRTGANLFMKFRLIRLQEQRRADGPFAKFLKPLRETLIKNPISRHFIKKLLVFTCADVDEDSSWAFTTIAVTGNEERLAIEKLQVLRFGWSRNEPIVRWTCPVRSGKVGGRIVYSDLDIDCTLLTGKYTKLCRYFVRGARCVLSENLCTTLSLAKGTQGVLEGLVWDPKDGAIPDISSMKPGEISAVRQPRYILVNVRGDLIPIGYQQHSFKVGTSDNMKNIRYRNHPADLLFAVTYHKLQGITLNKLILAINKHPNWRLRLSMSSLYVGLSRVHKLEQLRVLPYNSDDVDYLTRLSRDPLLADWINNYTKDGRWRHDGFANYEEDIKRQVKMELALLENLSELTIKECRTYISKLDIMTSCTKVKELRNVLRPFYIEGRTLLEANNGWLLRKKRYTILQRLRRLGNRNIIRMTILRKICKQVGILGASRKSPGVLLRAIKEIEKSFNLSTISKRKATPLDFGPARKKLRKSIAVDTSRHQAPHFPAPIFKGLVNPNNTCYFNSVVQCLLHSPVFRSAIDNVPEAALSITVLRELSILFTRMTEENPLLHISTSECFAAAANIPQCKNAGMNINRKEDVSEFLIKPLYHFA